MVSDSPFSNVRELKGIQSQGPPSHALMHLSLQTCAYSGQSGLSQLPAFPLLLLYTPNLLI